MEYSDSESSLGAFLQKSARHLFDAKDKDTLRPTSDGERSQGGFLQRSAGYLFDTKETGGSCNKGELNARLDLNADSCNMDIFIADISCSIVNNGQSPTLANQQMVTHVVCNVDPLELMDGIRSSDKMSCFPKTRGCKGSSEPSWEDELHIGLNMESASCLIGSFLYISLVKKQAGSKNNVIGTVALDLQLLCSQQSSRHKDVLGDGNMTTLELKNSPLLKNSILQGYLNCEIMVWRNDKIIKKATFASRRCRQKKVANRPNTLTRLFSAVGSSQPEQMPPSRKQPKAKEKKHNSIKNISSRVISSQLQHISPSPRSSFKRKRKHIIVMKLSSMLKKTMRKITYQRASSC